MKKPIPRKWYSLETAAKRLSVFFNDELTIKDILELALENEIRICWDMREHYLQPEKINDFPTGEVFQASGYYEISISEYPWHNDWLKELIREAPPNELATNKLIVKDNHGNKFTIVSPLWTKTDSGRNVQYFGGNFYPSIVDIFIYAKDLEEFEQTLQEPAESRTSQKVKSQTSNLLEALGVMAIIISQKISGHKIKDRPNASTIAELVATKADEILYPDGLKQFKNKDALRRDITSAVKHVEKIIQD